MAPAARPLLSELQMLTEIAPYLANTATRVRPIALVVEDDPRLQRSIRKELTRSGFDVISALHYDGALAQLATREPQIAFLDLGLPTKSGYELCEHIRGPLGLTDMPIVMTSEYRHPQEMAFAETVGANAFLWKPFSRRQLILCVDALLDRGPWTAPPEHELELFSSAAVAFGPRRGAVRDALGRRRTKPRHGALLCPEYAEFGRDAASAEKVPASARSHRHRSL